MIETKENLIHLIQTDIFTINLMENNKTKANIRHINTNEQIASIEFRSFRNWDNYSRVVLNLNQSNEDILKEFKQKVKEFITRLLIEED